jgi:Tfp pilus assembly protein PilN
MFEQYYRINQAAGVSVNILTSDTVLIDACGVVVKNNQLHFQEKIIGSTNFEELTKKLPSKSPIALNLFGKGVLQKTLDKIDQIDQNSFRQILPNANLEDFYVQNFISGNKSFISVIRKLDADKWVSLIIERGFVPLVLSLGVFPVGNIQQQLNFYAEDLTFGGHVILRNEELEWLDYSYDKTQMALFPIKIDTETIDEKLIVAYAAAFQLIMANKISLIKTNADSLESKLETYLADRKLKFKGLIALLILFVSLLVNFFLLSSLTATNKTLAAKLNVSAQSTNNLKGVADEVANKEQLLKELGWDGGVNKSAIVDQLASLLPAGVSWTDLTINPLSKPANSTLTAPRFSDGKIRVSGSAEQIIPVNEWLARIKTKKWVKNAQLDSYVYDSEISSGRFTVIIDF